MVTAEVIRELDRRAIEEAGIPGVVLMENAGRAVFDFIQERFGPVRDRHFWVFCGTGNNGGDGFVAARYLALVGARVHIELAGEEDKIAGDARTHYNLMRQEGVRPGIGAPSAGIKVDALLGIGASGAPRGDYAYNIRRINADSYPTVSVDIPSGVDADTGKTAGEAVRATVTVTFGYPKLGMFLAPGAECAGEIVVSDIGFPWETLKPENAYRWIQSVDLRGLIPRRAPESHKGMFGHVLILGGSRGMSGAPTMAARAALRMGAGLVTIAAPDSAQALIAPRIDEAMTRSLPERDGALAGSAFDFVVDSAARADVLCIGPGATRKPEARDLMLRVLREIDKPAVLDADGLNALADRPESMGERTAAAVLTPHPGECARLLGVETDCIEADRIGAVRKAATRYHTVCVLKGRRTLIADGRPGKESAPISINTSGNPGMATGGSGDSLTGIIGALIGQGHDAYEAACLGVYLHGRAGDLAAETVGETSLIAGDIIDAIPEAIRELEDEDEGST